MQLLGKIDNPEVLFESETAMTVAKHSVSYTPSLWETKEYHPLSPLASFLPSPASPVHSGRISLSSLISISGLRNTGLVVDMLASYPTGADKLLASLCVQSEDSQLSRAAEY